MGPCIIMLKHEVMVVDDWHDNQDLITVSLCIQIAINKTQLCLLPIAYSCPYHNPTASWGTLFTKLTSANRPHSTPYTWSAVVRPVGCTAKFSKMMFEAIYGNEINMKLSGSSSGGHSYSQNDNCTLPQSLRHLWHCVV
jgi:hypothetical protein